MTYKKIHIKNIYAIISIALLYLFCLTCPSQAQKVEQNDYFYVLNTKQGLADNHILQMIQLPGGKMAVETFKGINIYDGKRFHFIAISSADAQPIKKYEGQIHLYADHSNKLWIKNTHQLFCVDLKKMQLIKNPVPKNVEDLFVDSQRNVWYIVGNKLLKAPTKGGKANDTIPTLILLNAQWGTVQDIDCDKENVYTFHSKGIVAAFSNSKTYKNKPTSTLSLNFTSQAYDNTEVSLYSNTSLVAKTPNGQFYQIRTGYDRTNKKNLSIFLHFNPQNKTYEKIFDCDYILHTLNMSSDSQALISSQRGYLMFDFKVGNTPREVQELTLPDGKSLTTGINTVYRDQEGGIWFGTYDNGLIYVSPMLGLFFTVDKPWWQTGWGTTFLCLIIFVATISAISILTFRKKKINSRQPTKEGEHILKNKDENIENPHVKKLMVETDITETDRASSEFISKASILVQQHLQDSEYGVEQLANDLCMERTGLYKKLTSLGESTPVTFIRKIRLQQAAKLLKEGTLSVNEIAERTGFSSPSYFTKCFKKEFGMLPSEYK